MNRRTRFHALLLACACAGCPASEPTSASTSSGGRPEPNAEPEPNAKPQPVADPTPQPLAQVEVLRSVDDCPPLATLPADAPEPQRALVPLAAALRSFSCTPSVFGQTTAEAREALQIPPDLSVMLGRRYARFELGDAKVAVGDLLAAIGTPDAKMALEQGMHARWVVELSPWGLGVVRIPVDADADDALADGTLAELPADATIAGAVTLALPADALKFADDPHAASLLAAALTRLAEQPELLSATPEQARERFAFLAERFELHRYSEGLGDEQRLGFSLRPLRTELVAADLAAALALESAAHETIRITDTNPERLANKGETPFTWKGLRLEVELDERDGPGLGLRGWVVSDIEVLPAAGD